MNALTLAQLNRPLRILYALGREEFFKYIVQGKSPNAATIYRVLLPIAKMMETGKVECRISDEFAMEYGGFSLAKNPNIGWADIVVFPRIMNMGSKDLEAIIQSLKYYGKVIVYEEDDYYFKFGRSHYRRHQIVADQLNATRAMIRAADMITSPNGYLIEKSLEEVNRFDSAIVKRVIPNAVSFEEWEDAKQYRKNHKKVRILLSGAFNHYVDWMRIFPVLERISKKHGDKVELHIQGLDKRTLPGLKDHPDFTPHFYQDTKFIIDEAARLNIRLHLPTELEEFPKLLNGISPDIGLIVTSNELYDQCKSTLKFIDYTMSGATVIASNYKPYSDELTDGKNCCLVTTDEDWETAIDYLINHPSERVRMQQAAEELVKEKYDINATAPAWIQAFKDVYAKKHGGYIERL